MKIYLVRHGETGGNADKKHQDHTEKLSPKGEEQAKILGRRFQTIPINKLIASPYTRAQQTSQAIAIGKNITITNSELIGELRWPSAFVGQKRTAVADLRKTIEDHWDIDPKWKHSDEETFFEIRKRAVDFLEHLKTLGQDEHVAVVSHARFLKILLAVIIHGADVRGKIVNDVIHSISLNNTGITVIEYVDSKWHLVTINDHAHLGDYHRQTG